MKKDLLKILVNLPITTTLSMSVLLPSWLISDLASSPPPAEASLGEEAIVPIDTDSLFIEQHKVEAINSQCCILACVVFNKTEATRLVSLVIQTHVKVLHHTAHREQLQELAFLGVKAKVAHVESR